MTHPEERLARLWAQDEAPEIDPAFERGVSARIGRRQILREIGEGVVWAAPAAAVIWAVWPSIGQATQWLTLAAAQIGPVLVIIASTLIALWSAARLLDLPGLDFGALEYPPPRSRPYRPQDGFD